MRSLGLGVATANPSFLAVYPNQMFLYAVREITNYYGGDQGAVRAFSIDPAIGMLTLLNEQPSGGRGPCHLVVDGTGKNLLVANYGGGNVAVLSVHEDGRLGEASSIVQHTDSGKNRERRRQPPPHSINLSPDNRFAIVPDLGLDQVLIYRFDSTKKTLLPNDLATVKVNPGAGPRHLAFHPNSNFVYVIHELESTVSVFSYDPDGGALRPIQTVSTLPRNSAGHNIAAEVQVHPSGNFLYASNRGHDSIAIFAIDIINGTLKTVQHVLTQGKTPRHFAIDPTGGYLFAANQNSDNVIVFRIDPKSGCLTPTGQKLDVYSPVCVKFVAVK